MAAVSRPVPTIGSTWLWQYKGKDWPVLLCDDDIPPKAFIDSRLSGNNEMAAILLGTRK